MSSISKELSITVLVENTVYQRGLLAEHGLSFWIESEGKGILFDTGQGMAFPPNAQELHIPLEKAQAIVLSHGHYDHTGALLYTLGKNTDARIFLHPDALKICYHKPKDAASREIGISKQAREKLKAIENRILWTEKPQQIMQGIYATGSIPRETEYENTGGDFFLDEQGNHPDPIADDQSIWLETSKGIVVLLGCAHSGVINTLRYIERLACTQKFYALIGGMHLVHASPERLKATAEALSRYNFTILAPAHCTGFMAISFLHKHFPNSFRTCSTGTKFSF